MVSLSTGADSLGFRNADRGTSLVIQWLRLHTSTAGGTGSIPVQGTKIPHAVWRSQKKRMPTM